LDYKLSKQAQIILKMGNKQDKNKKISEYQFFFYITNKFIITFIVIGIVLHFVINDDQLNFDHGFECKKY